jgi:hypothetical protein
MQPTLFFITQIAQYLPPAVIIVAFFCLVAHQYYCNNEINLEELIIRAFSAGAIPTALVLLICAFKPGLLPQLSGFNIYIAVSGLVLLYISVKTFLTPLTLNKNSQTERRNTKPIPSGDRSV